MSDTPPRKSHLPTPSPLASPFAVDPSGCGPVTPDTSKALEKAVVQDVQDNTPGALSDAGADTDRDVITSPLAWPYKSYSSPTASMRMSSSPTQKAGSEAGDDISDDGSSLDHTQLTIQDAVTFLSQRDSTWECALAYDLARCLADDASFKSLDPIERALILHERAKGDLYGKYDDLGIADAREAHKIVLEMSQQAENREREELASCLEELLKRYTLFLRSCKRAMLFTKVTDVRPPRDSVSQATRPSKCTS